MAMVVDKAGSDGAALGIDRARGRSAQFADLDDLAVLDSDITAERRHPRAVYDPAIADQQIIPHRYFLLAPGFPSRPVIASTGLAPPAVQTPPAGAVSH